MLLAYVSEHTVAQTLLFRLLVSLHTFYAQVKKVACCMVLCVGSCPGSTFFFPSSFPGSPNSRPHTTHHHLTLSFVPFCAINHQPAITFCVCCCLPERTMLLKYLMCWMVGTPVHGFLNILCYYTHVLSDPEGSGPVMPRQYAV